VGLWDRAITIDARTCADAAVHRTAPANSIQWGGRNACNATGEGALLYTLLEAHPRRLRAGIGGGRTGGLVATRTGRRGLSNSRRSRGPAVWFIRRVRWPASITSAKATYSLLRYNASITPSCWRQAVANDCKRENGGLSTRRHPSTSLAHGAGATATVRDDGVAWQAPRKPHSTLLLRSSCPGLH